MLAPLFGIAQGWQHLLYTDGDNYFTLRNQAEAYFRNNDSLRSQEGSGYVDYVRWRWFWDDRIDQDGSYQTAIQRMYEYLDSQMSEGGQQGGGYTAGWHSLGPIVNDHPENASKALMGLVQSLWVDTSDFMKIYAGSNSGGLFLTSDGGENWSSLTDQIGALGVKDIIVHAGNPDIIWIATGCQSMDRYYGYGVLKSEDGGVNWQSTALSPLPIPGYSRVLITRILENPDTALCMYALGTRIERSEPYSYVFKTYDGFESVDTIFQKNKAELLDIEFKPGESGTIYVSGNQLYRSINAGGTWDSLTGNLDLYDNCIISRAEMAVHPSDPDVIMVIYESIDTTNKFSPIYYRRLFKSENIGNTFQEIPDNNYEYPYYGIDYFKMELEISPVNPDEFYLGGRYLYKYQITDDTSYNLEIPIPYHHDIRESKPRNIDSQDAIYLGNDGGVTRSPDGGNTWIDCSGTGLQITQFYKFGHADRSPFIIAGNQDGNFNRFNYSSREWNKIRLVGDAGEMIIDPQEDNIMYAAKFCDDYAIYKSDDYGIEFTPLVDYDYLDSVFTNVNPFIMHPEQHQTLFLGLHDIYRSQDGGANWDTISRFTSDPGVWHSEVLKTIAISKSNPNVIYAGFANPHWGYPDHYKKLVLTTDGGMNWQDITVRDHFHWWGLTDIEVDPNDPARFWISFGQHEEYNRVIKYEQYGATYTDISVGLPQMPVNCLAYYESSNPEDPSLFAGTDAGVFYFDESSDSWIPFNNGLPLCLVTELEINYLSRSMIASTFGRGMWETSLPCDQSDPIVIASNTLWDTTMSICTNVEIQTGATLTITGDVYIASPDVKICVMRGRMLTVNGGSVQSGCHQLWKGIEVWGNPTLPQYPIYQGILSVTNGGTIADACVAVRAGRDPNPPTQQPYSYSGGIVIADQAVFKNNQVAVIFDPYSKTSWSQFTETSFQTDNNYLSDYKPYCYLRLNQMKGIKVQGCHFETPSFSLYPMSGIYSMNSTYFVNEYYKNTPGGPDTIIYSSFSKLRYGIIALSSSTVHNITIDSSRFFYNKCGIYLSGYSHPTITFNRFYCTTGDTLYSADTTCGLYLDACTGYTVEENTFEGIYIPGGGEPDEWRGIGMVINNSGSQPNEIYRNYFEDCYVGAIAQNENRSSDGSGGLQIKCNKYENCEYDIAVTSESSGSEMGIKYNQGSANAIPTAPANNLFSYTWEHSTSDFHNECNNIIYHHLKDTITAHTKPKQYSIPEVNPQYNEDYNFTFNEDSCCPPSLGSGGGTLGQERIMMLLAEQKADSIRDLLDVLVDSGSTEALLTEVQTSVPEEAFELYDQLNSDSPYLSDTVMKSAIEKEEVLTSAMVTDILTENPQSAKTELIQQALDDRYNQLTEEQRLAIDQGWFIIGDKESLEANHSYYKALQYNALNNLIRYYRNDTLCNSPSDSIINILEQNNHLWYKYTLGFEYLEVEDSTNALSTLYNIPSIFELSETESSQNEYFIEYFEFLIDHLSSGKTFFETDSAEISFLYSLLAYASEPLKSYSRNLLITIDSLSYKEPFILPGSDYKTNKIRRIPQRIVWNETRLKIYPNPNNNYAIIEYTLMEMMKNGCVNIFDMKGSLIRSISIQNVHDYIVISTKEIPKGIYIVTLRVNDANLDSKKLSVF